MRTVHKDHGKSMALGFPLKQPAGFVMVILMRWSLETLISVLPLPSTFEKWRKLGAGTPRDVGIFHSFFFIYNWFTIKEETPCSINAKSLNNNKKLLQPMKEGNADPCSLSDFLWELRSFLCHCGSKALLCQTLVQMCLEMSGSRATGFLLRKTLSHVANDREL